MSDLKLAPAEFFEGAWRVTERICPDPQVVPGTEEEIVTLTRSSSEETVFTLQGSAKDGRSFELVGIAYKDGKIDGTGRNTKDGSVTEVRIEKSGDAKIRLNLGKPVSLPAGQLAGTWGAEKVGGT